MREIRETQTPGRSLKKKGDRRAFLAAAAGAAAGATAATLLPQVGNTAEAAPGDALVLGTDQNDTGTQATWLWGNIKAPMPDVPGFQAHWVLGVRNTAEPGADQRATAIEAVSNQEAIAAYVRGMDEPGELLPIGVNAIVGDPSGSGEPGGFGIGVRGLSGSGPGVEGGSESGPGVRGHSQAGPGVEGHSESGVGVVAGSLNSNGMEGFSSSDAHSAVIGNNTADGNGVAGISRGGNGVVGQSETGFAVLGEAPGEAPAVVAISKPFPGPFEPDGGLALLVIGKARFSTAGAGVVPARANAVTVSNPAVTAASHITVMFTSDPGGASVAWVERQPDTGFIVHLSGRARWPVPFTYLIVEPGA